MDFFTPQDSPDIIWGNIKKELLLGAHDGKHPFRYLYLATVFNQQPFCRMVVLRGIDKQHCFWVYTDSRTEKVKHLKNNPAIHLVFYHPRWKLQIRVEGKGFLVEKEGVIDFMDLQPSDYLRKDFTSSLSPGQPVEEPHQAFSWEETASYFAGIKIVPDQIEALLLRKEGHLRIAYSFDATSISSTWLVP